MTDPSTVVAPGTGRRGVLRGAAALGVAGVLAGPLAACGSAADGAAPSDDPTGAGGGRPTGEIVQAGDVPVHGGKILTVSGTKVVVTQPEDGTYKAFSAICTHRGCTVNTVEDDVIHCPCHHSEYDASTGAVIKQAPGVPAGTQAPLASIPITVQGGTVSFA